jgi:hypothetical protein
MKLRTNILTAALGLTISAIAVNAQSPALYIPERSVTRNAAGQIIQTTEQQGPRELPPTIEGKTILRYQELFAGGDTRNVSETVTAVSANVGEERKVLTIVSKGTMNYTDYTQDELADRAEYRRNIRSGKWHPFRNGE